MQDFLQKINNYNTAKLSLDEIKPRKYLIILLTMKGEEGLVESVRRQVMEGVGGLEGMITVDALIEDEARAENITFKTFETSDWNGDFSPWEYCMSGNRYFAGNGRKTLEKIKALVIQENAGRNNAAQEHFESKYDRIFLAGYSLAGLFSLWALHETDLFDGCACCSGSLWFEKWEDYSRTHTFSKPGIVYLSLGGKESKAKDPIVATIGEKMRREDQRLDKDPMVKKHTLVMNPGGHFASPDKRLAQGILWLIQEDRLRCN